MARLETLKVTSHVGRDLLAAATSFKTEAATVWEYVVNSLQYVDEGVLPKIQVFVHPRGGVIEVKDNGRGMTAQDLNQFFTMHGENIDRLRGRPGRGKFGTGKSAAFGIGKFLRVDTVRDGHRNVVQLHRNAIESSSGKDIELAWDIQNESTEYPNGTTISIEEIFIPKLSAAPIVDYIERHLQIFRSRMPEVAVNEHICQYREPIVAETYQFKPNSAQVNVIGEVELTIKVSVSPLSSADQGIAITAGLGNWVAVETAGIEAKEMGNYLFGEIDVPALESKDSLIEPYDTMRSLQLNPLHEVARVLLPFIGSKLEEVRKQQLQKLRNEQKTEEARRLAAQAQRIAEILNKDFKEVIGRLQDIRSASARPGDLSSHFGGESGTDGDDSAWVEGTSSPGNLEGTNGRKTGSKGGRLDPNIYRKGFLSDDGDHAVDPAGGTGRKQRRPQGGFNVDFRNLGGDSDRSKFDRTSLTILINLDHTVIKNSLRKGNMEDINFRRLAYEIAFTEYSIALGYEMAERDPDIPADDLLYEVRTTLNRISTSAASLYG